MNIRPLPTRARFVIVGGGVWGTSIAAHLAEQGEKDVLLVERFDVADGSSWAAAGFVGQLRHSAALIEMIADSARQYASAEQNFPGSLGWNGVGSLRIAREPARVGEIERMVALAKSVGVEATMLSATEVNAKFPMVSEKDMLAAAWTPGDGSLVPERLARHFADRAQAAGATVRSGVSVESLITEGGRVVGIHTDQGDVMADTVVVAAGLYTGVLTRTAGVVTPLAAVRVFYLVTNPVPDGALESMPTMREPDSSMYIRAGIGRVTIGGGPSFGAPILELPEKIGPGRREHANLQPRNREELLADAYRRLPLLEEVGISHAMNAWESAVPDDQFIIGPTRAEGLWVCAGGIGYGIAAAGGVGNNVARSLLAGTPVERLSAFSPLRFPADMVIDEAALELIGEQAIGHYALSSVETR